MNVHSNIVFIEAFYWLIELYNQIVNREELTLRAAYLVSSRFSAKTWSLEHFIVLLLIQPNVNIVVNYVRSRGEDILKAMSSIEKLIRQYTNNQVSIKINGQKKEITLNNNKINFIILNEINQKVEKTGGKIGAPIEYDAEYIITFFEEASQLEENLVLNFRQSVRGSNNTQKLFIFASNPWVKQHWLMKKFSRVLPENQEMEKELLEKGYNKYFDKDKKELYFRPRYTLNHHVEPSDIKEIEMLKEINYAKWRVVSLGFSGNSEGAIYQAALQRLNENVNYNSKGILVGGIDWGDGKSKNASPTTAYIGTIDISKGVDIFDEYEHWNNRGEYLNTHQQLERICDFFIKWYKKLKRSITAYIDNAALGDFYRTLQEVLRAKGYNETQIEFLPTFKPKNTWERVETLNVMLSLGVFRFDRNVCPGLYNALDNCYEIVKLNPTEEMKRQRSHDWTHWIHAIEYLLGEYFKDFQEQFPILMSSKVSNTIVV